MSDTINYIKVGGRLKSTAQDENPANKEIVAGADAIYDDTQAKKQSEINSSILGGSIYKTINGNSIVGEGNIYTSTDSYVTCSTEGSATEKVVVVDNYQLANGGNIRIKFTNANTATSGVTLKIKSSEDDTSAVAKPIYYSGSVVTNTNTWSAGETVAVYYDGTNYMANNVAGSELKTVATTNNPDTKKGLTESALVGIIGDVRKRDGAYLSLQYQIDSLSVTSTAVALRVRNQGTNTSFVRLIGTTGSTATWNIYGTSSPLEATMQLQMRSNGVSGSWSSWSNSGEPTDAVTDSDSAFYRTIATDAPMTYEFRASDMVYTTEKITNSIYLYYVQPVYYGALQAYNNDDESDPIIYTNINDLISGTQEHPEHLIESGARTSALGTYGINFDAHKRKVYILVPRVKVANINPNAVYWVSAINSNFMPFSRASYQSDDTTIYIDTGTDYYAWVSDRLYQVSEGTEGSRNIIFQQNPV